ncbi:MAG: fatty acid desaturase [Cyanobacteriota bacterium]|nr:fatty acid desaturase [Cyanobacteriota bacterium]
MVVSLSSEPSTQSPTPPSYRFSWPSLIFFIAFHLLALAAFVTFSWSALGVAFFLYWMFGSLGICLGYHRLLSHRSFQVPRWLEYTFATLGALSLQGGPIFWVSGHRQHHAFTEDVDKDPYSARKGFWWSHFLWLIYQQPDFFDSRCYHRMAPDLARDPYYQWLDKNFLLLQALLGGLLYLIGGWSFLIYGIFVRAVFLWHCTWLINSASHFWGYRRFEDSDDNARNLWWAAILAFGEGWHNNHHAEPKRVRAGLTWWEIDVTYWAIWVLSKLGLAQKLHQG